MSAHPVVCVGAGHRQLLQETLLIGVEFLIVADLLVPMLVRPR